MGRDRPLPASFFRRRADLVAPELLGCCLVRETARGRMVLRIVETEAYLGASDPASHAWNDRRTVRTRALFRRGGHAYVYFVYGMHHMLNAVTGSEKDGSAVLLRAGEPLEGLDLMAGHRGLAGRRLRPGALAGGPAKLCQALAIDLEDNGRLLYSGSLRIVPGGAGERPAVWRAARVGVDYAGEAAGWELRFAVEGNPHVSHPRPW